MKMISLSEKILIKRLPLSVRHEQRGAALVELTVVLTLFMLPVLFGVIEMGRLIYTYKTLVHQTHHTARYLSVQAPGENLILANCLFKTGNLQSTCVDSDALLPGFNSGTLELTIQNGGISTGDGTYPVSFNVVAVTVNKYPHKFIFSDLFNMSSMAFGPVSATFRQVN